MKIAIITFSDFNTNYGSMLQAFSMKVYLESLGHNVDFVRYREYDGKKMQIGIKKKIIYVAKCSLLKAYQFIKRKDVAKTIDNFEKFKLRYMKYTPLCVTSEQLERLSCYECYICGSDQIWNAGCLGGIKEPYFLSFAPKDCRKIAYAASVGDYIFSETEKNKVKSLLDNIDYISVRENANVLQINQLTDKPVHNVVDPVFLTTTEQWESYMPTVEMTGDYAVCYFVRRSKFGDKIVKLLSKEYKIPIYNLSDNLIYINGTESKYISSGPLEFISLIRNAKYTVGTSFHLVSFSIIFNIPFLAIGLESNRNRIISILELVGLENQFVTEESDFMGAIKKLFNQKTDYSNLNAKISESKFFLEKALNETI